MDGLSGSAVGDLSAQRREPSPLPAGEELGECLEGKLVLFLEERDVRS